MKLNNTKWAALLICTAMAMLLTACEAGGQEPLASDITTLIYANLTESGPDREAIDRFNRTHTDVQIEVRDYFTEDGRSGKDRLFAEMVVGQVPDILDMGRSGATISTAMLPYRVLAEKGYLEDLWPYIDNDPELGRESVVDAPLKAAEVNGGLYVAFSRVRVLSLAGAEQVVGSGYSWTLDDLKEAYAAMPEGSTILDFYYRRSAMLELLIPMLLDGYVDWESGQCRFDSEGFRSALAFINSFPEETDIPENMDTLAETAKRLASGRQLLLREDASTPRSIQIIDTIFGGRASLIGYPVEDGSTGSSFYPHGMRLAISSTCKDKEAAWEFVRQLFLPRESPKTIHELVALPINREDYDLMVRHSRKLKGPFLRFGIHAPAVELHGVTNEELARYEDFINSIDKIHLHDETIYDIVKELSDAYFTGAKTLDETAALIQNRVQLYVNENM